jgi:hypothetical protein
LAGATPSSSRPSLNLDSQASIGNQTNTGRALAGPITAWPDAAA